MKTFVQLATSSLIGLAVLGATLFWPAGTFNYWQAWVFIAVFSVATVAPTAYFARTDPAALRRRMRGGPAAEVRTIQKFIVSAAFLSLFAMIAFSAFDHRFGWSPVPTPICLLGDALVATGLGVAMLVIAQNRYAAANVTIEAGQTLASTGLYGLVRHPMYTANVIMMVGVPLALGSYWGLVFLVPGVIVLILRIRDEEELLINELTGYPKYTQQVRYRLLPHVW